MNDHRIYYTDTRPDSPFFGQRYEYMRNVDATVCAENVGLLNADRNSTLHFWSTRHTPIINTEKRIRYETQRNASDAKKRPMAGHCQERGRPPYVFGDRTQEQAQPAPAREIHVCPGGPRPAHGEEDLLRPHLRDARNFASAAGDTGTGPNSIFNAIR